MKFGREGRINESDRMAAEEAGSPEETKENEPIG